MSGTVHTLFLPTDLGDYDFAILISAYNSHKSLLPLCAKGYSILIAKLQKLQHVFSIMNFQIQK